MSSAAAAPRQDLPPKGPTQRQHRRPRSERSSKPAAILIRSPSLCPSCAGGFARFNFQRHIPRKGFSGITVLGMVSASVGVGFALYASRQRRVNDTRLARQQERKEFLQQLDGHLSKKSEQHAEAARPAERSGIRQPAVFPFVSAHVVAFALVCCACFLACVAADSSQTLSDRRWRTCWPWSDWRRRTAKDTKRAELRRCDAPCRASPLLLSRICMRDTDAISCRCIHLPSRA